MEYYTVPAERYNPANHHHSNLVTVCLQIACISHILTQVFCFSRIVTRSPLMPSKRACLRIQLSHPTTLRVGRSTYHIRIHPRTTNNLVTYSVRHRSRVRISTLSTLRKKPLPFRFTLPYQYPRILVSFPQAARPTALLNRHPASLPFQVPLSPFLTCIIQLCRRRVPWTNTSMHRLPPFLLPVTCSTSCQRGTRSVVPCLRVYQPPVRNLGRLLCPVILESPN